MKLSRKDILFIVSITFILSVLFVLVFSYSTSPFYPFYFGSDSAQFQTIGKYWAQGMVPYRDLFDHKGPLIFWINMLGYSLFADKSGLIVLQIISLFVTLLFMSLIFVRYCDKKLFIGIFLLLCLGVLTVNFTGGNITEEYCLPFLAMSLYFQLPYFEKEEEQSPWWKALIYGLSFGVCFFTRFTNGISVCCGVMVIGILIIKKRRWAELVVNGLSFLAGFSIIAIPFCIYFYQKGLLYEMIYSTFLYNYIYSGNVDSWLRNCSLDSLFSFFKIYFVFYSFVISLIVSALYKKNRLFSYLLVTFGISAYVFGSVYLSPQYPMVLFPHLAVLLGGVIKMVQDRKKMCRIAATVVALIMLTVISFSVIEIPGQISRSRSVGKSNSREYDALMAEVPENEYDRFAVFCDGVIKDFYLLHDIPPIYKFFACQEWHAHNSERTAKEMYDTFNTCKAKWILECGPSTVIQDILDTRYHVEDIYEGAATTYILYQLSE